MSTSIKIKKAKTSIQANDKPLAPKAAKPSRLAKLKQAVTAAPATDTHSGKAATVAQAVKADAVTKYAELNKAFLSKYNKRPIFGEKRPTPIDLSKHNPTTATERDTAFIHAIRTVYGNKPFTANDLRADTGNIARAIKLNLLQALPDVDGVQSFRLAPSLTATATPSA